MIKRIALVLLLLILWTGTVVAGALFGWWRRPIAPAGDASAFMKAAVALADANNRANTAIMLIEADSINAEYYSTRADTIDRHTVFATASLSKWITAHAVMKLVEQGKLDLDRPVDQYLTRWHLPAGAFSTNGVTARRLLSHTAGLTDGLGFGDYRLDEPLPSLEETLRAPRRSDVRDTSRIVIGIEPGTTFRYSGGGYLVLELLIEELSGETFETFVTREILQPLGMQRSGYADLAATPNSAKSYRVDGTPAPIYRYASRAATGFASSPGDLSQLVFAHLRGDKGAVLSAATLASMRNVEARSTGADLWGLGTILYAPTKQGSVVFGHDGANDPAISSSVRINPETHDAIIVLATGSSAIASRLGAEWVLWQTGVPDVLTVPAEIRRVLPVLAVGVGVILLLGTVSVWRRRKQTRSARSQ